MKKKTENLNIWEDQNSIENLSENLFSYKTARTTLIITTIHHNTTAIEPIKLNEIRIPFDT